MQDTLHRRGLQMLTDNPTLTLLGVLRTYSVIILIRNPQLTCYSAFTLVILFCTGIHLCHHLSEICFCCYNSIEKIANPKIPNLYNGVNLLPAMIYILETITRTTFLPVLLCYHPQLFRSEDEISRCCEHICRFQSREEWWH